jgi:hypothetical protein
LVLVEVLQMARWRVESALAIVSVADASRVVPGVVVGVLPSLLPLMVLIAWAWYRQLRASGKRGTVVASFEGALVLFTLVLSPLFSLLVYLLLYLGSDWLPAYLTRRRGRPVRGYMPPGERRTNYMLFLGFVTVVGLLEVPHPWVPEEVLSVAGGMRLSGFVVGESAAFTTIVASHDAALSILKTDEVLTRTVCHGDSGWLFQSILVSTTPRTSPVCP